HGQPRAAVNEHDPHHHCGERVSYHDLGEPEPIDHAGDDGGDLLDVGDRRPGPTRQLGRHHPIALCGETPGERRHLGRPTAPAVKSENEWAAPRLEPFVSIWSKPSHRCSRLSWSGPETGTRVPIRWSA